MLLTSPVLSPSDSSFPPSDDMTGGFFTTPAQYRWGSCTFYSYWCLGLNYHLPIHPQLPINRWTNLHSQPKIFSKRVFFSISTWLCNTFYQSTPDNLLCICLIHYWIPQLSKCQGQRRFTMYVAKWINELTHPIPNTDLLY